MNERRDTSKVSHIDILRVSTRVEFGYDDLWTGRLMEEYRRRRALVWPAGEDDVDKIAPT